MTNPSELFRRAQKVIPGGVNSPVRAFKAVGGSPVFIARAEGAHVFDESGRAYIDYVGSWGPMVLGHAHPDVIQAVQEQASRGLSYGAPTELETRMAERVCELLPSIEMLRMVNSGTEATMSAIRLARGFTGRDLLVKFEGCYHGHADALLVKAGSGALTLGVPTSAGVPQAAAAGTLTLPYNDIASAKALFLREGRHIAAVIVEPVAGNMNCVPPLPGFLEGLRDLCDQFGAVLVFDEVMTGFRVALGGAQARYGVKPDLTTLGKVIGGGLPVGGFGGRRDIMSNLAPVGPVYQAGTLSGNPLAMAAGLETLAQVSVPGFFESLEQKTLALTKGLRVAASQAGVPFTTNQVGGMFGLFFTEAPAVATYQQVMACDSKRFSHFFHGMLERGIYLAPSAYEAGFVSAAHTDDDLARTIAAATEVFGTLTEVGR